METIATGYAFNHDSYEPFLASIREHFASVTANGRPLFTTDTGNLFHLFLGYLPAGERQHHTCHACRHFVERFGGLVTIDENGRTEPAMWGRAPGIYSDAFAIIGREVSRARVTGVFLSSDRVWGQPVTGEWRHMAVTPAPHLVYRASPLKTAGQAMAEKREEHHMLCRGLAEFPLPIVEQARTILDAEALYRNEKCQGPARWLADLHRRRDEVKGSTARDNVTWLAVASAPPGFCHVRSTMIGTLLEDIAAGLSFDSIKRRFAEKMNPLQYQRPQAPPSAGNIAQAEKVVAALQSAGAFARRFARLDEVQAIWRPREAKQESTAPGSVFGHLVPKGQAHLAVLDLPAKPITWEKFEREVLPMADKIEFLVPMSRAGYIALVTAADMSAPPILQWDSEEARNPVNCYVYHGGSHPSDWDLRSGSWVNVNAVTLLPSMWGNRERHAHQGAGAIFILDGCRDLRCLGGAALFPETLRSEYHAIRATIEAHSRSMEIAEKEHASACGIDVRKGSPMDYQFRVTNGGSRLSYIIDRWD